MQKVIVILILIITEAYLVVLDKEHIISDIRMKHREHTFIHRYVLQIKTEKMYKTEQRYNEFHYQAHSTIHSTNSSKSWQGRKINSDIK